MTKPITLTVVPCCLSDRRRVPRRADLHLLRQFPAFAFTKWTNVLSIRMRPMAATAIEEGVSYGHSKGPLRFPDYPLSFVVPKGCTGSAESEEWFTFQAETGALECSLEFHDKGDWLVKRWVNEGWQSSLAPAEQFASSGDAFHINKVPVQPFETSSCVGGKFYVNDQFGNGFSARLEVKRTAKPLLRSFVQSLVASVRFDAPSVLTIGERPRPPASAPPAPSPKRVRPVPPPAEPDPAPVLAELQQALTGKLLSHTENQSDRDYSGGSSYFERTQKLSLYPDGTFRFDLRTFTRVSSSGISLPSENSSSDEGTWRVQMVKEKPGLVLLRADGSVLTWWHTRSGGAGVQYLDEVAWKRFRLE
jgi:hypothetical protein